MSDGLRRIRVMHGLASLCCVLMPGVAKAHVKWFCGPIDASLPPAPLGQVLSPLFFTCLAGFAGLVALGGGLDALLARIVPASPEGARRGVVVDVIVRVGMAAYAVCLWRNLAVVLWADDATGSVLTPEMLNRAHWIGLLQLVVAVVVLIPPLSLAAAAGLVTLFAIGVARFAPVYMIDYLFFVGLATYIALGQPMLRRLGRLGSWRESILTGSLSLSLMWTAVEKFLFPQWTIAVLLHHPSITAGFPFPSVATIAGFVEFSLSFYLLVGRPVSVRLAAVLLAGVFVMAMPAFGIVDVVGHTPVIVILVATLLQGETRLRQVFRGRTPGLLASGGAVLVRYVAVLTVMMSLYYGLHAASVWAAGKPVTLRQPSSAGARPLRP